MKQFFSVLMMLLLIVTFSEQSLSSSEDDCDGVYHNGDKSNSWFGDGFDDFFNLDWDPEPKPCYTSGHLSVGAGSMSIKLDAKDEVAGCTWGDGSCCEQLCTSGAGAWSMG